MDEKKSQSLGVCQNPGSPHRLQHFAVFPGVGEDIKFQGPCESKPFLWQLENNRDLIGRKTTSLSGGLKDAFMNRQSSNGNGLGVLKSKAEKFLLAKHGQLEHIPRPEVKKLVNDLQIHQIQMEKQHRELLRARKTVAEVQERCVNGYDCALTGNFTLDREGIITEVSLTGAAMLRTEKERLLNQPLEFWVAPEFQETWKSHVQEVLETGTRQTCEIELRPPNGAPFQAVLDSHPVPATKGQGPACHTSMREIIGLKQVESDLRLKERMLDGASDSIFLHDLEGRLIYVNEAACRERGYEKDELLHQNISMLMAPEYALNRGQIQKNLLGTGELIFESAHLRRDGSKLPVEIQARLIELDKQRLVLSVARNITKRKKAEKALRQSEKELTLRNRIAQIFLTLPDDAIYAAVLEVVQEALESKLGIFGYIEENGTLVVPSMTRAIWDQCQADQKDLLFSHKNLGEGILARALREGRTFVANEPTSLTPPGHIAIARSLIVPIRYFDKVIGVLAVANKAVDYNDPDIRCLEMIADSIAPILNARLQKNRQKQGRQWAEEALRLAAHKWRTTFDSIGDAICLLDPDGRVLQCNQAALALTGKSYDAILGRPCWQALYGLAQPLDDCPLLRMKQSLHREELIIFLNNRWLKETVDPILDETGTLVGGVHLTMDITAAKNAEAALQASEERFRAIFDQAAVGVALVEIATGRFLKVNQKFCDILGLTSDEVTATTFKAITHPDDLQTTMDKMQELLDGVVQSFSVEKRYYHKSGSEVWGNLTVSAMQDMDGRSRYHIAVVEDITQRRQAEIEVRQALDKLRQALVSTVGALSNTVEIKDPYTARHQRRVAKLACAIAQEMELPPDQVEGIHVLSFLHDIGKIAVPAEILSRPGKISSIEFNLIRAHSEMGYNILKDLEFPWPVAQAVLQHHERLDGSGYPRGLTEKEIIQEARILAVADVVEAMASHRPYRPALGVKMALQEIMRHQGKLFDASVVTACVQIFEKGFSFQ
jgi:PAS domain S-box-containing protein